MRPELICLQCRSASLYRTADEMRCTNCQAVYPVVQGIPRFVSPENYANSFGFQWNRHDKTQLDSYIGLPISRDRVFSVTQWPSDLRGQTILEAGCGAGRFTEILVGTGADVISFDLSSAVEANRRNNGHHEKLTILQASILDIPVAPRSMDKVFCLGVIQHTPDPEKSFQHLAECVKPGGDLVIDVYAKRLTALLSWRYLLRPLTKRIASERLYKIVEKTTRILFPVSHALHRLFGRPGARLLPIAIHPNFPLPPNLARQWAILDTFDIYSPAHDHPKSQTDLRRWFENAGFVDVYVGPGPNGYVARGKRPT